VRDVPPTASPNAIAKPSISLPARRLTDIPRIVKRSRCVLENLLPPKAHVGGRGKLNVAPGRG
jgi:hypothetical protein